MPIQRANALQNLLNNALVGMVLTVALFLTPQSALSQFNFNGGTLTIYDNDFVITSYIDQGVLTDPAGLATTEFQGAVMTFIGTSANNTPVKVIIDGNGDYIVSPFSDVFDVFSIGDLQTPISSIEELSSVAIDPVNQHLYIGGVDHMMVCTNIVEYAYDLYLSNNNPTVIKDCHLVAALPAHTNYLEHGRLSLAFNKSGDQLCYSNGADCDNCVTTAPQGGLYCMDMNAVRPLVENTPSTNLPLAVSNGIPAHTSQVAQGVRYSMGLDFHPETQELWFTDANPIMIDGGTTFTYKPDAELNVVAASDNNPHFGFPFVHAEGTGNPWLRDLGGGSPINDAVLFPQGLGAPYKAPQQVLGPHAAPLGLAFYDRDQLIADSCEKGVSYKLFPETFNQKAIVAEWGSWDALGLVLGYRIVLADFDANRNATEHAIFMDGFRLNGDLNNPAPGNQAWARPYGLEVAPDGSLLISDSSPFSGPSNNYIFRVQYTGADAQSWTCPVEEEFEVPLLPALALGVVGLALGGVASFVYRRRAS